MTLWNVYAGTFTKEFGDIFQSLRASENEWERKWIGGGTASSQWKPDTTSYQNATYAEGIEHLVFDAATGSLTLRGTLAADVVNPQHVSPHPRLPVVYAPEYSFSGRLLAFEVDADGSCLRQTAIDTLGRLPIAAAVHPAGRFAYVAHWGDGTLTQVALNDQGAPIVARAIVHGHSHPDSPDFSRHHQVRISPNGRAVLVTDVGRDVLTVFRCDDEGVLETSSAATIAFPAGSGPRHLSFHPSGRFVFVVTERQSSLFVLAADDGVPTRVLSAHSTVPAGFAANNRPSELCMHPSGRWLYVGNRGLDSVTVFSVESPSEPAVLAYESSHGRNLSALLVDPTGSYLLAGNVIPGSIAVFGIGAGGGLELAGAPLAVAAPRSLTVCPVAGAPRSDDTRDAIAVAPAGPS